MRNFVFISVFPFYRIKEILAVYKFYLMTWCHQIVEITFRSLQKLCKNWEKKLLYIFEENQKFFIKKAVTNKRYCRSTLFDAHFTFLEQTFSICCISTILTKWLKQFRAVFCNFLPIFNSYFGTNVTSSCFILKLKLP